MDYSFFLYFFISLLLFFSITTLGYVLNKYFFNINIKNFYENFLIGIFCLILYLQIHIIFFEISLLTTIHIIFILISVLFLNMNHFKINNIFLISLIFCLLIIYNSDRYPYYSFIYDYGYYHNGFIKWLNNENLIWGISNIHPSYGILGNSFILGSFLNFYPIINKGYIFTTGIFFIFFVFFSLSEIKKINQLFPKIFLIFIFFVISKYIFEEPLGDYTSYKIHLILYLFLFYKLIIFIQNKEGNFDEIKKIFLTIVLLISLSPLNWFFAFIISISVLIFHLDKLLEKKLLIVSITYIAVFFLINFLKSGHILYPIETSIFIPDFATNNNLLFTLKNFPKGYLENYEWIKPALRRSFMNSFVVFHFLLLLVYFLILPIIHKKIDNKKIFFLPYTILNICILFWFFNSPDPKTGKVFFWCAIIFGVSYLFCLITKFFNKKINFFLKYKKFTNTLLIIILITVSALTSLDNSIFFKDKTHMNEANKNFPSIKKIYLKNKSAIFELRKLDYSMEKFTTTYMRDFDEIEFEKKFFSKFNNHNLN